jgi:3-hydroxyacyl-[acyl-carrier-protein] dehydratase
MRLEYFQMIDAVEDLRIEEQSLTALALVPGESVIFEGHFPGRPLMPGVLLIETMAQASGFLILGLNEFRMMPFLASVKDAKMRSFVEPNAQLKIQATLEHEGSGYAMTRAQIHLDQRKVCDAKLTFRTMPFPSPDLEMAMRARADEIGLTWSGSSP